MTTGATTHHTSDNPTPSAHHTSQTLLQHVELRLRTLLTTERERWTQVNPRAVVTIDALAHMINSGGKRIRPTYCLTGYLAAGGDPDNPAGATAAAAALEMLHASALIHDDVLDNSHQRRGQPTIHTQHTALHEQQAWQGEPRRFGEGVALLTGNLALVYSEQLMADAPTTVTPEWNTLRSELMIGQYMDVAAAAEFSADPQLSRWIALIKSGRYTIHRPLVIGASAANRADLAPAFEEYGEAIGEAFQLRDDLLDAVGDTADTGKPAGLDLSQHKMTLLLGWAMQRDEHIHTLITQPGHTTEEIRDRLVETGVPKDIEKHIANLVERGCKAITDAPIHPVWRSQLKSLAHQVAYRNT
ncbi:polyprenyl synthetase family protein [Streptomyces sp. NA04227]|uniref:polyprenyl synthetase family protein n=1 Tax=Streptomyces sp. NA04227 TaxID=2742136 RepID=UPI00158F9F55|nr:polyprenyl synthetase family protein [Streptomyces sp. NA04227]QKW10552.1 polyprenyl synthetase family protein [Streptomyces sp. NA04227]